MKITTTFLLFVFFSQLVFSQDLTIYEVPGGFKYSAHNDDFTVRVRKPEGEWQDLFEYKVEVDMDNTQKASMVTFDFEGKVEVQVRKNNGIISSAQIRPLALEIDPQIKGQIISFNLDKPTKLSLEVNGDKLHNLHLFANALLKEKPAPNDPNVMYFGPGIHQPGDVPGDVIRVQSGKTVYIDGGAILKAKLLIENAHDVKIIGRGIIWQPERGIEIRYSQNVTVDGLIFVNPKHYTIYGGQSKGLEIRNIKSFSNRGWSDGIDLMSCSDVVINDVFMRNSDDCIAIYGHRWDFYGNAKNYQIKNSILWADIAHPTNIGGHGNAAAGGDTIENVTFSNIDILEHDEDDRNYQGCLSIACADNNLVQNITYENIRIDDFQEGQIFSFRVVFNEKYSKAPGRSIRNVSLKNIIYQGNSANPSVIQGYDKVNQVKDVRIEGLVINGKLILNAKDGDIKIGDYTNNIRFKK